MPNCQQIQTVKTFQNPLDNSALKCYNMRALNERHREDLRSQIESERAPYRAPRNHKKVFKKLLKNLLTKSRECDIIIGSLCERLNLAKDLEKNHEKFKKLLKNLLTKSRRCDIIVGHFRKMSWGSVRKNHEKVFKKLFKNPLTNRSGRDIINGSRKTRLAREPSHRSLIIEQQEIKVQA